MTDERPDYSALMMREIARLALKATVPAEERKNLDGWVNEDDA
jgi:hypothetical protein